MDQRVYAVNFDTQTHAGYVYAVKVSMSNDIVDLDEKVRIDLCDDADYPALHAYCMGNPPRKATT